MALSIFSRKKDLIYLIFFAIHLPVMFLVDLTPFYPESIKPAFLTTIRQFYVTTFRDQFFIKPPAWFDMYLWMEAIYHIPLSSWAISALLSDDPKVPLHLLIYACQTGITTLTCIADYLSWPSYTNAEKLQLGYLYVPYFALSVFMGVDMFGRLSHILSSRGSTAANKKSL